MVEKMMMLLCQCNLMVLMRPPTEHDMAVHISAYILHDLLARWKYKRNHIISQQSDNGRKVSLCLKVLFPKVQLLSDNKRSRTPIKQCSATFHLFNRDFVAFDCRHISTLSSGLESKETKARSAPPMTTLTRISDWAIATLMKHILHAGSDNGNGMKVCKGGVLGDVLVWVWYVGGVGGDGDRGGR